MTTFFMAPQQKSEVSSVDPFHSTLIQVAVGNVRGEPPEESTSGVFTTSIFLVEEPFPL